MRIFVALFAYLLFTSPVRGGERDYQEIWCVRHSGRMEYRLPDSTRVDCLTDTHAVEMDFGRKWAEAIGQSLYYSACTGKRAGVVLILKDKGEVRFLKRLEATIESAGLPIDVWIMQP